MSSLTGLCAVNHQLAFFEELNETGPSVTIEISISNPMQHPRKTSGAKNGSPGLHPREKRVEQNTVARAYIPGKLITIKAMNRRSKSPIHK